MIAGLVLLGQLAIAGSPQPAAALVRAARVDTAKMVNVAVATQPETLYVGQQATYRVAILVDEAFEQQLRRYPTLTPPDIREMLAYDLPLFHDAAAPRVVQGRRFDAHVFQRALFPLTAGRHVVPSAEVEYMVPVSAGFFSQQETIVVRADSVILLVRDLPTTGQPPAFSGAVGRFAVSSRLSDTSLRVGDPIRLSVRITGQGNVKLLPRPVLEIPWASLVPGAERVTVDTTSGLVGGAKDFDWVLTPRMDGEQVLPDVSYSFFDPAERRYATALSAPIAVRIASGTLVASDTSVRPPALAIRRDWTGPARTPLPTQPLFWLIAVVAPLPALARWLRRRPRAAPTRTAEDDLRDLLSRSALGEVALGRRLYVAALAERSGLPVTTVSSTACMGALEKSGVSNATARRADAIREELDRAVYAGSTGGARAVLQRGLFALEAVAAELRRRAPVVILALASALVVGTISAQGRSAAAAFADGVARFDAGEYETARDAFAAAATLEPQAPDAWANYGTAAWMAGDTATAVAEWQHAVRLAPRASDMRLRLADAGGFDAASQGWVAPVTVNDLALPALAAWMIAWLLALAPDPRVRRWAIGVGSAAVVAAAGAALVAVALSSRHLAVVRSGVALHALPALGADTVARTADLALVRVAEGGTAWYLITTPDGMQGWVAAQDVVPIGRE